MTFERRLKHPCPNIRPAQMRPARMRQRCIAQIGPDVFHPLRQNHWFMDWSYLRSDLFNRKDARRQTADGRRQTADGKNAAQNNKYNRILRTPRSRTERICTKKLTLGKSGPGAASGHPRAVVAQGRLPFCPAACRKPAQNRATKPRQTRLSVPAAEDTPRGSDRTGGPHARHHAA